MTKIQLKKMAKVYIILFLCFCSCEFILNSVLTTPKPSRTSKTFRINIPSLGIGHRCEGCPFGPCDDYHDIIFGYCCGCARWFDYLPVTCGPSVHCPLNTAGLCDGYEYMMHCCCA